jgi:hypothetical protein
MSCLSRSRRFRLMLFVARTVLVLPASTMLEISIGGTGSLLVWAT